MLKKTYVSLDVRIPTELVIGVPWGSGGQLLGQPDSQALEPLFSLPPPGWWWASQHHPLQRPSPDPEVPGSVGLVDQRLDSQVYGDVMV